MDSGFRRREIVNNEVRLGYLDNDGDGPVVVALHGLAGTGDEFIATEAAVGGSYRFVLPDLRGHGSSTRRLVVLEATVAGGADPVRIGDYFRSWPVPFASAAAAEEFLGQDALARSWIEHLEPTGDGGLVPSFDADIMQAVMEGVAGPRWPEWKSVTAPTTAVFAAKSMFGPDEQADFVAARPGTRHVTLSGGSHDAHLDATTEWAAVLASALQE